MSYTMNTDKTEAQTRKEIEAQFAQWNRDEWKCVDAYDFPAPERIICAQPWPCDEALRVAYGPTPPNRYAPVGCPNGESSGNPRIESAGGHAGLYQLDRRSHEWRFLRRGWTWADAFDPERNVAIASEIFAEQGWAPWSCRP